MNMCLRTAITAHETTRGIGDGETTSGAPIEGKTGESGGKDAYNRDETPDKSTNETAKPAEVPESSTDMDTNPFSPKHKPQAREEPQKSKEDVLEDDGVHIEGGDEDSVIY
jgi:hypothetical protein